MHSPRFSTVLALGLAAMLPAASRAADPALTHILPAGTALALHVRNVSELRTNWERTPFARTWAEPEVQKFFAPLHAMLDPNGTNEFAAKFQADMGLTPTEMLEMFPGEAILAIVDFSPYARDEENKNPQVLIGAQIGSNRAKIEELLKKASEKSAEKTKEHVVEEEFQGETLHVTMKPSTEDGGGEGEAEAWAIVGEVLLMAEPKSVVQQAIANLKRGGADESLADAPGFAAIYQRQPDADVAFYVNVESIVPAVIEGIKAKQAAAGENAKPSPLDQLGITPEGLAHALGFDAIKSLHVAAHIGTDSTTITSGLQWSEQRGLLRLFAFGDPPAPQAAFVPDTWLTVSCARYSIPKAYAALKDTLNEVSPAFGGMLQARVEGINQALGIDLENDLIANLGDEFTRADALPPVPVTSKTSFGSTGDNLVGISLNNAEAFKHAVEAVLGMAGLAKSMQTREYLGETINTFPTGRATGGGIAPTSQTGISYAITQNHLFVSVGSPAMLESAVQGQNGAPNSLWKKPEVTAALGELPEGGNLVVYYDARRLATMVFDALAAMPMPAPRRIVKKDDDDDDASAAKKPPQYWDRTAKPSAEAIEKHWKSAAGAGYLDADGIHSLFLIQHAE